ncbi:unnamed protein product [Didymodactylos carnosus]|uniref:Uncharacterized protein n=1 Tax=Didymodactylos carnosus TaxID=1234261 RepID=A0A813X9P5_9BILA|nr:unnamed protein product [Didymodactylos carnosus]CAF0880271.1 unnamed protein product [Didymodactylos carnosus]CAF3654842.1 unnamed protein product [Didymodactylos carnosus]CAF3664046.1 unnamed protein product [Didymodactylos carnosus]
MLLYVMLQVSARKLVRALFNNLSMNEQIFQPNECIIKQNIPVESYKCKCPLIRDEVYGLCADEHDVTNMPCSRAEKEVLCYQHLQYHHNLSSRAAKKIVLALLSCTNSRTKLFHVKDLVTQSKCAVRKLKCKCPLVSRHIYGDRADQQIFVFHHLTYFHKMNGKAATKLIRALLSNKDPLEKLFHYDEVIISTLTSPDGNSNLTHNVTQQKPKRSRKSLNKNLNNSYLDQMLQQQQQQQQQHNNQQQQQLQIQHQQQLHAYNNIQQHQFNQTHFVESLHQELGDMRTKYQSLLNAMNTSALSMNLVQDSSLMQKVPNGVKMEEPENVPLDCSGKSNVLKMNAHTTMPCQMTYSYNNGMGNTLDLNPYQLF